jgi:hypothetical protein
MAGCSQPTLDASLPQRTPTETSRPVDPAAAEFTPDIPAWDYAKAFGKVCTRVTAPIGTATASTAFEINIPAGPTSFLPELPSQHQGFPRRHADLLGPYCETDRLSVIPWKLFEQTLTGWSRVQAILEFRPQPISFDYMKADRSRAHGGSSVSSC